MVEKRLRCAAWLAMGAWALGGCTVERAHTIPFDGKDNKGVVYSVQKTYLAITLQYSYTQDDLRPLPPVAHLDGALQIVPRLVPDAQSTFLIKTDSLVNNALFLSSVRFDFRDGTLAGVDANSVDRTGQVLQQLGTVAVNLAKAAAKGPQQTPHEKAMLAAEKHIDEIYLAIAKVAEGGGDPVKNAAALEALQRELTAARSLILDLRRNVDPPTRTWTAPLTVMVDPDKPTRKTEGYLEYEIRPPQLFADVPADNMDVIVIRIHDDHRRGFTEALHEGKRKLDVGGIIYRQPVRLLTEILAGDPMEEPKNAGGGALGETKVVAGEAEDGMRIVCSDLVPYLQFSPPAVAVLDSKIFTAKHTTMVFDTVNGGMLTFGIAQDSPAENAAQAAVGLSNSAAQIEALQPQANGKVSAPASGGSGSSGGGGGAKIAAGSTPADGAAPSGAGSASSGGAGSGTQTKPAGGQPAGSGGGRGAAGAGGTGGGRGATNPAGGGTP